MDCRGIFELMKFNEARKLAEHLKKFDKEISNMVTIMGNEALNHFIKSFPNQGFEDENVKKWAPRKRMARKERGKPSRGILIQSGRLWRSLRKMNRTKYSISIATDVIYARRHNDGINMPKRQFMGDSAKLKRLLIRKFNKQILSINK